MNGSICLIILFNHKYVHNVKILDKIYSNRFSSIYYIMPFYNGELNGVDGVDESHIITVYESSYCFQGYIAQAYEKIKNEDCTHYLIIADDLLLNPRLNEKNLIQELELKNDESYIQDVCSFWRAGGLSAGRVFTTLYPFISRYVNYQQEIPSYDEAAKLLQKHGYEVTTNLPNEFWMRQFQSGENRGWLNMSFTQMSEMIMRGGGMPYPFLRGYADILLIDKKSMAKFCHLSGIFAAMGLFVEIAIPTIMPLACDKFKTDKDLKKYRGVPMWTAKEKEDFWNQYNRDPNYLMNNFAEDVLFYHPIKMSTWRIEVNK